MLALKRGTSPGVKPRSARPKKVLEIRLLWLLALELSRHKQEGG